MVSSEVYILYLCLCEFHQSTVAFCQAAANRLLVGLAVRYDTTDVSI